MSLRIDLDTSDYDVKMTILRNKIPEFTPRLVMEGAEIIDEEMHNTVPVKTGKLKNSIQKFVEPMSATIQTSSGYGLYVDEDTSPHVIQGNPILRFEVDGEIIFRRKINHPGTKGQHFRRKTLDNFQFRFLNRVRDVWNELMGVR